MFRKIDNCADDFQMDNICPKRIITIYFLCTFWEIFWKAKLDMLIRQNRGTYWSLRRNQSKNENENDGKQTNKKEAFVKAYYSWQYYRALMRIPIGVFKENHSSSSSASSAGWSPLERGRLLAPLCFIVCEQMSSISAEKNPEDNDISAWFFGCHLKNILALNPNNFISSKLFYTKIQIDWFIQLIGWFSWLVDLV